MKSFKESKAVILLQDHNPFSEFPNPDSSENQGFFLVPKLIWQIRPEQLMSRMCLRALTCVSVL